MIVIVAAVNSKLAWYVARSSGFIAWAIVTAGVLWGLAVSTRLIKRKGVPAWCLDLHKFLGTLSVVFVAVHVLALWADTFVYFGPRELLVPMASSWRPGPVAWGIAATYLLVAIQLTSWTMRKLPRRLWHAVHLSSFPMFVFATVHGFTAGADNMNVAVQWAALTGALLVIFLLTFRFSSPRRSSRRVRPARSADRVTPTEATPVADSPALAESARS
jgi:predicted ferric reductase